MVNDKGLEGVFNGFCDACEQSNYNLSNLRNAGDGVLNPRGDTLSYGYGYLAGIGAMIVAPAILVSVLGCKIAQLVDILK